MKKTEVVYTPNYRRQIGVVQSWILMCRNIIESRELVFQLFRRDFLMAYKKSFFGIGWLLISPIVGIVSWVLLNSAGILKPGEIGIPYPAFALFSSLIWGLFMGFYGAAAGTLNAGAGFIMQVKFPHEVLLVKQTAQHLANFLVGFGVNLIVLIIYGVGFDWKIIFFPLLVIPLFFFAAAIGLFVSVVSVVVTDLSNVAGIILGITMYITPVIYQAKTVTDPILKTLIELNPLTYLVGGVRDIVLFGYMDNPGGYLLCSLIAFLLFMFSWRLFFISEDRVIEKMI